MAKEKITKKEAEMHTMQRVGKLVANVLDETEDTLLDMVVRIRTAKMGLGVYTEIVEKNLAEYEERILKLEDFVDEVASFNKKNEEKKKE